MNGLLVIDKPGGMTSRDVVNRVQRWFPRKTKIGHTGTLDPLATGVLVVCIGSATRLADFVQAMGKTYRSRFRLGATSSTDDADGEVASRAVTAVPGREQVEAALASMTGSVEQMPPVFSALKVSGERAHDLARQGKPVPLVARTVRIDAVRVLSHEWPFLDVEIDCGKGTYVRSIARDLGEKLGCGGMVETLRRTRIGPFAAEHGIGLEATPQEAQAHLLPMATAVAEMPEVRLSTDEEKRFRQGQAIRSPGGERNEGKAEVAVLNDAGDLIGIGTLVSGSVKPDVVFR